MPSFSVQMNMPRHLLAEALRPQSEPALALLQKSQMTLLGVSCMLGLSGSI